MDRGPWLFHYNAAGDAPWKYVLDQWYGRWTITVRVVVSLNGISKNSKFDSLGLRLVVFFQAGTAAAAPRAQDAQREGDVAMNDAPHCGADGKGSSSEKGRRSGGSQRGGGHGRGGSK